MVFMDINPMSLGHVLVLLREPVATLTELPPETVSSDGKVASQSVLHVHIHVIPRYRSDVAKVTRKMLSHVITLMLLAYASKSKKARL